MSSEEMKPFLAFVYFLFVCLFVLSTFLKERNYCREDDISKSLLTIDPHCGMLENK